MRVLSRVVSSACDCVNFKLSRNFSLSSRVFQNASVQEIKIPPPDNEPAPVSPKIENLVNEISKLSLFEVSELTALLKKKLNIPDTPMMAYGLAAAPAAAQSTEEAEEAPKIAVKSTFSVKLVKFNEAQKISLVKAVKEVLPDMNLVQAKKFVDTAPVVLKADVSKEEADKIKETLEKLGGEILIE